MKVVGTYVAKYGDNFYFSDYGESGCTFTYFGSQGLIQIGGKMNKEKPFKICFLFIGVFQNPIIMITIPIKKDNPKIRIKTPCRSKEKIVIKFIYSLKKFQKLFRILLK